MDIRSIRLPSRESLIVLVGYGTAGATLLLTLKALTILLVPAQYGLFALGLSAQIIFVQLIFGPLGASVLRLAPDAIALSELRACILAARSWVNRAIIVGGIASLAGGLALLAFHPDQIWLYSTASISALIFGASQVNESVLSGTRHRTHSAFSSGLGQIFRSGGAILTAFHFRNADAAMAGYMAGGLAALGVSHMLSNSLVKKLEPAGTSVDPLALDRSRLFIAEYGKPFLIWAGPTALYMASDRWLLQFFSGSVDVAILSAAQQIAQLPVNFLFQFLQLFWAPILFADQARSEATGTALPRTLDQVGWPLLALCLVSTVMLYGLGEPLVRLFATPAYLRSAPFIPLIFLGACLFQLGQWFTLDQLSQKRSDLLIWPKLGTALLGIASYVAGAYYDGLRGLVIASVAVGGFYLGTVLLTRRSLNRQ